MHELHKARSEVGAVVDRGAEDAVEGETALTSAADVESAGRSCLVILVLVALILLTLCVWIGFRSTGGGQ